MKFTPREYQTRGIRYLLEKAHAGLFLEPGLGKTATVLAAYTLLKRRGFVKKLLVVAPRRVCLLVWPQEAAKWDEFKHLRVHFLHGKGRHLRADADVYLINPEGLPWLLEELRRTRTWPFEWLVVDESTKFKKSNTVRFKLLRGVLHRFLRRTILTGAPTPKGLLDLFGQVFVMDLGQSLGRYVTHYRNEFFYPTGFGGYTWVPQPDAHERILARLEPSVLTMRAEDWLELPERVDHVLKVTLPSTVMAQYQELEREMVATLATKKVVVGSASAVSMKCRQLASGGVYRDVVDPRTHQLSREVVEVHEAKVDALEELRDELAGEPLLVAYEFAHDLTRLRRRFGADVPALEGGLSDAALLDLEARWNRGDVPLLLAQASSTAHGLNLQAGGAAVAWFSLTYDYETFHQFNLRVLRQGQLAKRVKYYYLVAEDTVDEDTLRVVLGRHTDQRRVLADLVEAARRRLARPARLRETLDAVR